LSNEEASTKSLVHESEPVTEIAPEVRPCRKASVTLNNPVLLLWKRDKQLGSIGSRR
jgi:hypothetical protein